MFFNFCIDACSLSRWTIPDDEFAMSPLLRPYTSAGDLLGHGMQYFFSNTSNTPKQLEEKVISSEKVQSDQLEATKDREKFIRNVERLQEHYPDLVKGFIPYTSRKGYSGSSGQLLSSTSSSTEVPQRVCDSCASALEQRAAHTRTVQVLELCEFDIVELRSLGLVCRKWHRASILCLSSFRQMQYYLPSHALSDREKRLLKINARYLKNHSKWMLQLLKTVHVYDDPTWTSTVMATIGNDEEDTEGLEKGQTGEEKKMIKRPYSCMLLMCSRLCTTSFASADLSEVLNHYIQAQGQGDVKVTTFLRAQSIIALSQASDIEWLAFIPMLVTFLMQENVQVPSASRIGKLVLTHAAASVQFSNDLFWELQVRACQTKEENRCHRLQIWQQLLLLSLSGTRAKEILRGSEWIQLLETLPDRLPQAEARVQLRLVMEASGVWAAGPLPMPLDPTVLITNIRYNRVEVKSSAEAPLVLPCLRTTSKSTNTKSSTTLYRALYKRDDLRKDRIVQDCLSLMYTLLRQEVALSDLPPLVTYRVLPTSPTAGLIEMVENAETLYTIIREYGSILHFLHRYNGHQSMKDIRASFAKSCAAYTVITFLLGVGDRHTENVMLTRSGSLFHIDYGFLLGRDPKPLQPPMRLDSTMIEALGDEVDEFKDLCVDVFNCLRRHVNLFLLLLTNLVQENDLYTSADLEAFVIERFLPGQSDEEAATALKLRMEGTMNERIGQTLSDFVHAHASEKTVSKSMSSVGETVQGVASSISTGASSLLSYYLSSSKEETAGLE